jgi:hypothetical protein
MHDFSCLVGTMYGFNKNLTGTRYTELLFLYLVGSTGHVVHSGASRARNVDTLFFMLGWDWHIFNKKHARTRYTEQLFLDPVGSAGHIVHSGASRARNVDALFFMLGSDWHIFNKKHAGTRYAEQLFWIQWDLRVTYCMPVCPGHEASMHYFSFSGGTGIDSTKTALGHVTLNLCFYIR